MSDRVETLVAEALRNLSDPSVPVAVALDNAIRIARLRRDGANLTWLLMETQTTGDKQELDRNANELRPYFGNESEFRRAWNAALESHISLRSLDPSEDGSPAFARSVREMEQHVISLTELAKDARDLPGQRTLLLGRKADLEALTQRLRNRLFHYLSTVEAQLHFDARASDTFEAHRAYVDARLQAVAPAAFEQLSAAYQRRAANEAEARSHALTSCRRALKSLADALYPATGEAVEGADGQSRKMTDDRYISRLLQFVTEKASLLGDAQRDLLRAEVALLGQTLDALNDLASKGVHASTSDTEVDHCILQTYLTAGNLLRLADTGSVVSNGEAKRDAGGVI
jgi:hypothetical protein